MNNPEVQRRGQVLAMTAKTLFVIASEAKQSSYVNFLIDKRFKDI
jgi:hypothetical protein